jgi:hypothetical protein
MTTMNTLSKFVADSGNEKIGGKSGKVSATYASIEATCDKSCPLMGNGCFAEGGRVALVVKRLANASTPLRAAQCEAREIDRSFKGGPVPQDGYRGKGCDLRLHVSGDCRTTMAAATLGSAARRWRERGGGDVWTYTHAWRKVTRASWGESISVLASVERSEDGRKALEAGYAPAIVVSHHASPKAYEQDGVRWIPCPAQTSDRKCVECRLCFDADALNARNAGIAFAAHGQSFKRVLKVIQ